MKSYVLPLVCWLCLLEEASPFSTFTTFSSRKITLPMALYARTRRAKKRQNEKQSSGRSKAFVDAMEEVQTKKEKKKRSEDDEGSPPDDEEDEGEARRSKILEEAEQRIQERPELSTMITDEETEMEYLVQGQSVMDVVTRKAVKLSDLGPDYRLAQMFPGVPPEIREKYRCDWTTVEVDEMVEKLREACSVELEDGSRGIPPHPSVSNKAIDFVLANRDLLGERMEKTLTALTMRAYWKGDANASEMKKLSLNFATLENYISGPFRQIIQLAEGRIGPNFGNLDLMKYCQGDLYERVANYVVLKGMVAHWEKKVVDADYLEKTPKTADNWVTLLCRGDPQRYLKNSPILFTVKDCTQVCAMAQQMCNKFVATEELFGDFPAEIVFFEEAMKINGGAALRNYMNNEFCPGRGIAPEGLREGVRRFYQQLQNLQNDPYLDITSKVGALCGAIAVGTDDEREPYMDYLMNPDPEGPGYFQTYTFNFSPNSLVRYLDSQYPSVASTQDEEEQMDDTENMGGLSGMLNLKIRTNKKPLRTEPKDEPEDDYDPPEERKMERPHELGWFERLNELEGEPLRLGKMPPGRIIP